MKPFAALDQVLNDRTLTPPSTRQSEGLVPAGDFQPFFAAAALASSSTPTEASEHAEPQIEMIEADGRVQQIVVTCRCGERTVLDCAY